MYLVFSAFTSRPISLLATTKGSVFFLHSTYAWDLCTRDVQCKSGLSSGFCGHISFRPIQPERVFAVYSQQCKSLDYYCHHKVGGKKRSYFTGSHMFTNMYQLSVIYTCFHICIRQVINVLKHSVQQSQSL